MGDAPVPNRPPEGPEPPRQGISAGVVAAVLLVVGAVAIFSAGLSLGGQTSGRDAGERAALEAFTETYRRISSDYVGQAEPEKLIEGAIRGMFDTLGDPYSAYMGPDEYAATFAGIVGEFEGVGARMGTENLGGSVCEPIGDSCLLRVTEVLDGSPARDAGLMDGDVVTAVDGISLENQTVDDAVLFIRGPRGSDVALTITRDGKEQVLIITRDVIVSQDVQSMVLADGRVGYLRLDGFSSRAAQDFKSQLQAHLDAGILRLVVDLRDDPGGFVDAAVEITSQFLAEGVVFWEESADGSQRPVEVVSGGLATDPAIEVVVLVDGGSASASEILAGALQDAGRAQLVGETTFGKGTVQEWTQLPGKSGGFRLSVAKWLTRDKAWVHGIGLTPDVPVAGVGGRFRPSIGDIGPDAQLDRAVTLLLGDDIGMTADRSQDPTAAPSAATAPLD